MIFSTSNVHMTLDNLRNLIKSLIPPIVLNVLRMVRKPPAVTSSVYDFPLCPDDKRFLVERMDRGDFDFEPELVEKMLLAWERNNSLVPYPTVLTNALVEGNALEINSLSLMEISYRLPYSIAYERSQNDKYLNFVDFSTASGIDFTGATVLDVGAGLGGLLDVISRLFPTARLVAAECASSALNYINAHRPHMETRLLDLNWDPETFSRHINFPVDVVLCSEVLEHLAQPDKALHTLLALNPKLGVVLSVPNGRSDTAAQHIHFWSPESWEIFLKPFSNEWLITVKRCPSPGSPGGFDNMAIFRPRTVNMES